MSETKPAEPFEAFMSRALMDPVKGYYSRQVKGIGLRGDFATSASVGGALARAIAGWLKREMQHQSGVRTVIEIGGGEGSLMKAVRRELGWWRRHRLRWIMVERSEPLIKRQREELGTRVVWHSDLETALLACGGKAFIWHNELLDALPFSLVQWCAEEQIWKEVWLKADKPGHYQEELRQIDRWNPADFSITREWGREVTPPTLKQRGEAHTGIYRWLQGWASGWTEGAMLCLDYGDVFPHLYLRRPRGTARAYLLHHRLEGLEIYGNEGKQDITSDVNFADLRRWCRDLGFEEIGFGTQAEFLLQNGRKCDSAADRFIANPEGAGSAFKFLTVRPAKARPSIL